MIKNQWYVVAESNEVGQKGIGLKRLGEKLFFWREKNGKVVCFINRCPHRGVELSKGQIINNQVQCPFHGLEFDSSGRCTKIPANGKNEFVENRFDVKTYETREINGFIFIWWGKKEDIKSEPDYFENIDDSFTYMTVRDPWKTHYSRVIENQLDCAHIPFVHKKTIGRGNKTLVNGPKIMWKKDAKFHMYVYNEVDNGQKIKKPEELEEKKDNEQRLEFIFPNLWQNYITEKMRVVAAFVPIDDENTIMYLRIYQNFMTIPILSSFVNWVFCLFNKKVAHEDRYVVETQVPKRTDLNIGENLFQADLPIIEYRKYRNKLINKGE